MACLKSGVDIITAVEADKPSMLVACAYHTRLRDVVRDELSEILMKTMIEILTKGLITKLFVAFCHLDF